MQRGFYKHSKHSSIEVIEATCIILILGLMGKQNNDVLMGIQNNDLFLIYHEVNPV